VTTFASQSNTRWQQRIKQSKQAGGTKDDHYHLGQKYNIGTIDDGCRT
jgi:hypothetical protein